jgi:hypothetical protein
LTVGIRLEGYPNDRGIFERPSDEIKARALQHATNVAPSFMEHLGSLTELEQPHLSFDCAYRCSTSPFLALSVGPLNGLDQLRELCRLEYFAATGILHEVGASEVEWMARHWPRLKKIQIPIFSAKKKTELPDFLGQNEGVCPDYGLRFTPSLEVVKICKNYYKCRRCHKSVMTCQSAGDQCDVWRE